MTATITRLVLRERSLERSVHLDLDLGGRLLLRRAAAARDALRSLELSEQVAAATLLAAQQGVWLRQRQEDARPLPAPLAAMHSELAATFLPLIEDRALEGELRLCLEQIRNRHWRLYA